MELECAEDCFELPEWRELLTRDPNAHVFATPEYNRVWWEEFGAGKELYVLTMRRGGDIAAFVPLYRKEEDGRRILRFVGGIDLTDYLGPICSLEDRDAVADALVGWLASTDVEWDELDAHNMPVPFGFAEFLVDRADRRGFAFTIEQEETAAVLPLPDDWDAYVAELDSRDRHELRRKRRRLARDYPDAAFRTSTEDELSSDLERFFAMHRRAEGEKGRFMADSTAQFFVKVAHAFGPLGWLRLDWLELGGRAVAACYGFELGGRFYLYNSAYEPDASRLSPGLVLVSELVKSSIEKGLRIFDFLRGGERYKYQLGAQTVPLNNVRVVNDSGVGRSRKSAPREET